MHFCGGVAACVKFKLGRAPALDRCSGAAVAIFRVDIALAFHPGVRDMHSVGFEPRKRVESDFRGFG